MKTGLFSTHDLHFYGFDSRNPELLPFTLSNSVNDLELSVRAANALNQAKLHRTWHVIVLTNKALLTIPKMGKGSVQDIRRALKVCVAGYTDDFGLKFREEFWRWAHESADLRKVTLEEQIKVVANMEYWAMTASVAQMIIRDPN